MQFGLSVFTHMSKKTTEFCVLGQCCVHRPTYPSDGFHDIVFSFQYYWLSGEKCPDVKMVYFQKREIHLHNRRYFDERLLDVDEGFARSIDYLHSAQYATEHQQMEYENTWYIEISIIVYSEKQRHVVVMRENSHPNTLRICNNCTTLWE